MKKNYSIVEQLFVAFTEKQHYKTSKSGNSLQKNNFLSILSLFLVLISTALQAQTDTCSAPTTLTVGTGCSTTAYNVKKGFDNDGPTSCSGTSYRDGWYQFTTDATTTLITIEGTSDRQLGLGVYTGTTCGSLTQVACTVPGNANATLTNITVSPNTTYKLRLMRTNNANNNDMSGTICVYKPSPACSTPTTQPTALILTPSGTTINSSFTAASPAPSGYLVVYNTTNTVPNPADGTTYTIGGAVPNGTVADTDSDNTFSVSGLTPSTTYYFFVFSYNNGACSGGPKYLESPTAGPLTANVATSSTTNTVPSSGNNSITTCSGNLYDSGGNGGNYVANSNGYTVINPGTPGSFVRVSGTITSEAGYDYLTIYDGTGTGGAILWGGSPHGSGTSCTSFTVPTITSTTGPLTIRFYSDSTGQCSGFNLSISCYTPPVCTGTPSGGTVTVTPTSSNPGSTYTISANGFTIASGLTFQWQSNTNNAGWVNVGAATTSYSNHVATAPAVTGTIVQWRLVVTCSGNSGNSTTGSFTTTSQLNVPSTGNNSVSCGSNLTIYDNGGSSSNYSDSIDGYTVINVNAVSESYITITGNYETESSLDLIRIYQGTGIGGTLIATYSGTGSINFVGNPGQTYTIRFNSDSSVNYSGFAFSVTYNGTCAPPACGRPTVTAVETSATTGNASWTPSTYGTPTGYYYAISTSSTAPTYPGSMWTATTATSATFSGLNSYTTYYVYVITDCGATDSNSGSDPFTTQLGPTSNVTTGCPSADSGWQDPLNGSISYTTSPPTSTCISSSVTTLAANYLPLGSTSSYSIERISYNPPSAFTGLANPVSVGIDDVWSPVITLPFNFCFWGNTYTRCRVGSNSIITFDPDTIALTGTNPSSGYAFSSNIPQSTDNILLKNSIFGVFHDIDPSKGGTVGWELKTLASGCRALVVAYNNVPLFGDNTKLYTGMMVLYENTNVIEVYIKSKPLDNTDGSPWNGNNAIVGIQNATGTQAAVPPGRNGLDADWTATNEAWRFTPVGDDYAPIVHWFQNSISAANEIGTGDTIAVQPTTTTTYYSQVEYKFCNDGGVFYAQDNITVTVTGSKTWNGSVSSDWNTANNWTPSGVPTALDCVVIPTAPRNAIVSGANYNGLGHNLTVQNGGNLSIASPTAPNRTSLTITDVINVNNGGNFTVNNSANLIQINNVANTGNINMLRNAFVDHRDYVYWSSPVAGFNSADISTYSGNNNLYKWTPTVAGNGVGNFGNWFSGVETMVIGKGYIERGLNSAPLNSPTTFTATFTGVPNNGNITTPISRGTYNTIGLYTSPFSPTDATQDDDNWNLIGNPYPSSINAKTFLTANAANLDGFIKVWTHGIAPSTTASDPFYNNYGYNYDPADYLTYNLSGAQTQNGFDGYIGAGQSFITKMLHTSASTSANAVFNNAMRSNTYRNDQFYKNSDQKSNSNPEGRIWLDIVSSTASNSTLVAYVDGATNSKDQMYDAQVDLKANFSIYSLLDGYDRNVIQGRSLPFDQNDQVPLAVKLPTTGSYNIAIQGVDGLFSNQNQNIYLEDKQLNLIHDLRSAPYTFNGVQGENLDRFVLRYTNQTLSNNDFDYNNAVNIFADNSINVKSSVEKIKEITVYDVLGKTLVTKTKVDNTEISITEVRPTTNVLIVKVKLENDAEVVKKVIY